jgi:ferric-dicitrate binding protein FerR (iron transport regulator)
MTSDRTGRPPAGHEGTSGSAASDLVERLVRLAGEGPAIPPDGIARVKTALRPEWLREVGRRRQRRVAAWGLTGLAAAAALAAALLLTTTRRPVPPHAPATAGRIAALRGRLEVVPQAEAAGRLLTPALGAEVSVGAQLRTGPASLVALDLSDGASLRLDRGTSARFVAQRVVLLDAGAVYVDSRLGPADGIEVRTPLGSARETGTQFEVRHADDGLVVRVREGSVAVSRRAESFEIDAGTTMTVLPDGSTARGTTRPDGPEWQWAAEVAPALQIEGQSALVFLHWVSRETGLALRFGDHEVERLATETILHGTIEGLAPAHAAEVVLPGCGLGHRVIDGALVVERVATERRDE